MSGAERQRRSYRGRMGSRFASFTASYKETDLWIGVDPASYSTRMEDRAVTRARSLRLELETYIAQRPEFLSSLVPIAPDPDAPRIASSMIAASAAAGVGPMASVAGAFADIVGAELESEFGCREIIVENGGDLWLRFEEPLDISVFAGDSPLSEKLGVSIPPGLSPLGLCTSSGTIGPSLSLGCADAAMVAARTAALADAWATTVGNAVASPEDMERALALCDGRGEIVSVLVILGARMGIRGLLPLKLFR
jgi:ApbE superfamily uncharacterized protein (UPF0280 family)